MSWSGLGEAVLDLPVTTGRAVAVFVVVTGAALIVLAARRDRRWLPVGLGTAVGVTVVVVALAAVFVEKVWRPFPDSLPLVVLAWTGAAVLALALLVGRWFIRDRDRSRPFVAAGLASVAAAVLVCAAGGINAEYDEYPTLGSAFGHDDYRLVPFDAALAPAPGPGVPLSEWSPPDDLPRTGAVAKTAIPATLSGFSAREARVYLPPAYFADPRPDLPVLVLLAGQPGTTDDWLVGGRLARTVDAYAADHRGVAPVVVLADGTGGWMDDPLCVDSHLGNAATYLGVDVPNWIRAELRVDPDPRAWAVGGLSYGGTCALQLATTRPQVYPTFLDMSGQAEPIHADRAATIREVFGGGAEAFARNNPADLLARNRYPGSAGAFVVGVDDTESVAATAQLAAAARAAGMDVHVTELPGGHTFEVWSAGLEKELPWLGRRLGIADS